MRVVLIILSMLATFGCAMVRKNEAGVTEIKYGNFCGKGWPEVPDALLVLGREDSHANWLRGKSDPLIRKMISDGKIVKKKYFIVVSGEKKQISSYFPPAPKDSLDEACQMHDVCYALSNSTSNNSGTSTACDYFLHQNVISINRMLQGLPSNSRPEYSGNIRGKNQGLVDCIRLSEHLEMFAATRVGSFANPSSLQDVYSNAISPVIAAAYIPFDTFANGVTVDQDKMLCVTNGKFKMFAPTTVSEYKTFAQYYENLPNKSGYEGEGLYKVQTVQSGNKVKISIMPTR